MTSNSELIKENQSILYSITGWIFGIIFLTIGLINIFWGNDPEYGAFILLLSLAFYPPVNSMLREKLGFSIPLFLKIVIGLFIIWSAMGVGELFDKIDLMLMDLK